MPNPAPERPRFTKIRLHAKINLGEERELVQSADEPEGDLFRTTGEGPQHSFDPVSSQSSDGVGEQLEFKLTKESKGDLDIIDKGLTNSFGIFGAPGAGKTTLMMHLLRQIVALDTGDPQERFGALVLDPKSALIDEFRDAVAAAGRLDDLRIIGTGDLVNVIDCSLDPYELGSILVLSGRAAGIDASDPFWFQEWSNLFASTLSLLRTDIALRGTGWDGLVRPVTLRGMLDAIFEEEPEDPSHGWPRERRVLRIGRQLAARLDNLTDAQRQRLKGVVREDVLIDIRQLERFYKQEYVGTIEAFINKAFGMFRRSRNFCYSDDRPRPRGALPFYEDIVESGRIVIIAISPSEPALAKTLCTLVKCLFQRAVLARGRLVDEGILTNVKRPLLIACDEYSEIASEVPGQSMGDGQFLALARQYGCMAIFATQSVNVLKATSLGDNWRSVFGNFAAKIYMRLSDNETADEAVKLAGESDWKVISRSTQTGGGGASASRNQELRERKNLPSYVLTHRLKAGQAVVIGALDGGKKRPGTRFLSVPDPDKPKDDKPKDDKPKDK